MASGPPPSAPHVRNAEEEAATARQQAREAQEQAEAERKRKQQAKAKARAEVKAREEAERESPDVVVVTRPPSAYDGPVEGDWSGVMADGNYTFWLTLYEYGGSVTGEMYQQDSRTGEEASRR